MLARSSAESLLCLHFQLFILLSLLETDEKRAGCEQACVLLCGSQHLLGILHFTAVCQ